MRQPSETDFLERLEALFARIEESASEELRAASTQVASGLLEIYGRGLERILELCDAGGAEGAKLRDRLVGDPVVASLLLVHDLYPVPLEERVAAALEQARPHVEGHGGSIALLAVEAGVARIRLGGTCDGCPSSASTLDHLIREALAAEAPDLAGLEVVGEDGQPLQTPGTESGLDCLDDGELLQILPSRAASARAAEG